MEGFETGDAGANEEVDCGDACKGADGGDQTFLDLQFRIKSGPPDGRIVETVKRVRVHFDDAPRNRNPKMLTLELSERIVLGEPDNNPSVFAKLTATTNESLVDEYTLANGTTITEEPVINWYSTAGTFYEKAANDAEEQPISFADQGEVFLKLPTASVTTPITIWGILRDGRGGTDYQTITLEPDE